MNSQIFLTRSELVALTPVVMIPISISPVLGSVADYFIAVLIRRTASCMSCSATSVAKRILAIASEILIMESNYLGVAVIVFLVLPMARIFLYSLTRVMTRPSGIVGLTNFLA